MIHQLCKITGDRSCDVYEIVGRGDDATAGAIIVRNAVFKHLGEKPKVGEYVVGVQVGLTPDAAPRPVFVGASTR